MALDFYLVGLEEMPVKLLRLLSVLVVIGQALILDLLLTKLLGKSMAIKREGIQGSWTIRGARPTAIIESRGKEGDKANRTRVSIVKRIKAALFGHTFRKWVPGRS
jgi:hypothetical protein